MTLTGWDISADHVVPSTSGVTVAGFRACLGLLTDEALARNKAESFVPQLAETLRRSPEIVTLDYDFLAGPLRNWSIDRQMAFYVQEHRAELACLDWEDDSYSDASGGLHQFGMQPFPTLLRALALAKAINPGVYASLSQFSQARVSALLAAKVPFLWIAAYGIDIPDWLVSMCRVANVVLMHQYTGTGVDRSRVLVGDLADLHRIAGRSQPVPGGDVMTNLVPLTCHRVLDLSAGTVLEKTPGGAQHTKLAAPITLGLLGATGTHYQVADGDYGVYVNRTGLVPRVADKNVGA